MKMMVTRKNELANYIELLMKLERDGFRCKEEINQALSELHSIMFFKDQPKIHILVLEKDFEGVVKSLEIFTQLLPSSTQTSSNDDFVLEYNNIKVSIIKVDPFEEFFEEPVELRCVSANYVINNTGDDTIIDKFGIRVMNK